MQDRGSLGHSAKNVAAHQTVAHLRCGSKLPLLLMVYCGNFHTTSNGCTHFFNDLLQRSLDTIVNTFDHTRTKFYTHRGAGGNHFCAGSQAGGFLIDLNGRGVTLHGQDLTDQSLGAYTDHVGHIGI